jgi:molybdate transport system substrate-binding protein
MRRAPLWILVGVAVLGVAAGCGDASPTGRETAEVTVLAAASLTDAFTELGEAFEAATPDVDLTFSFAASSALAAQIRDGAPADVFASADLDSMEQVADAGDTASAPVVFTTNRAEIIVAPGNPLRISGLGDLADPELIVVACAPEVPCGRYAQRVLDSAGVSVTPKSLEENVRAVVSKVTLGEADAGIVYATDVTSAGDAAGGVEIPADINVVAEYPIAAAKDAPEPDAAQAFVDFVLSDEGQAILASHGFVAP